MMCVSKIDGFGILCECASLLTGFQTNLSTGAAEERAIIKRIINSCFY
jgi:hypothetical protein